MEIDFRSSTSLGRREKRAERRVGKNAAMRGEAVDERCDIKGTINNLVVV